MVDIPLLKDLYIWQQMLFHVSIKLLGSALSMHYNCSSPLKKFYSKTEVKNRKMSLWGHPVDLMDVEI